MPYWSYQKVKKELDPDKTRYDMKLPAFFIQALEKKIDAWPSGLNTYEVLPLREALIEETLEIIGDVLNSDKAVDARAVLSDVIRVLFCKRVIQKLMREKELVRFFLEPTIAKALATTSVKGLTTADLPVIDKPLAIFLPPGIQQYVEGGEFREGMQLLALFVPRLVPEEGGKTLCQVLTNNKYKPYKNEDEEHTGIGISYLRFFKEPLSLDVFMNGKAVDIDVVRGMADAPQSEEVSVVPRLLINLLLYWKSTDADVLKQINPEWEKVKQKIHEQRSFQKREKLKSRLKGIPQHEHLILGQRLEVLQKRKEEDVCGEAGEHGESTGKRLARHSRTGHWKWQPCGVASKERKLIFVETYWAGRNPPKEKIGYSVRS